MIEKLHLAAMLATVLTSALTLILFFSALLCPDNGTLFAAGVCGTISGVCGIVWGLIDTIGWQR